MTDKIFLTEKQLRNFWKKVDKTGECWIWTGARNRKGYGMICLNKKCKMAHRISFELYKEIIPEGKILCHHCDTPSCVNPDHVYIGTCRDNSKDSFTRGQCCGAKLTRKEIPLILEYKGKLIQREIAKIFGVSQNTVSRIFTGETWGLITGIKYKKKRRDNARKIVS